MSKFKVGDKVKVVSTQGMLGERLPVIGNIYKIVKVSDDGERFKVEGFDVLGNWMNSGRVAIPANDSPKEITLNGATYVLKEEPKPYHEWKFGDIAVHEEYGVGIVCSKLRDNTSVRFLNKADLYLAYIKDLTFLRRADLSV